MIDVAMVAWKPALVAAPTMSEIYRAYLRLLLGGRKQDVLARALGVKRAAAGHLLNGLREVSAEHLQAICDAWEIRHSSMLADLARVAQNLEMGRPAGEGLGGTVYRGRGADVSEDADAESGRGAAPGPSASRS